MIAIALTLFLLPDLVILPSDLDRFPNHETCETFLEFNRVHAEWLTLQQGWGGDFHWSYWQRLIENAEQRRAVWRFLDYACESTDEHQRLYYLCELRKLLGEEAWSEGWMPAPVERFW
jgi:hypothetical protein